MFGRIAKRATAFDDPITKVLTEIDTVGPKSDKFPDLLSYLERLTKLKAEKRKQPLSRDTMAIVLGNIFGILIIVAYEQRHVMTSQGLKFLIKPKS